METEKVFCTNCNQWIIPDITEYEEDKNEEGYYSGKLCPICEEYIY